MILCSILSAACTAEHADKPAADVAAADSTVSELPMPMVPANIEQPSERAAYMIRHFWDTLNFDDTVRCCKKDFIEQNFSNFVAMFPVADESAQKAAVETLLKRAAANASAYGLMVETACKYLYDPNSPMYNEQIYELFVDSELSNAATDEAQRERLKTEKQWIGMNAPGTIATDFKYRTAAGTVTTLLKTPINNQLLLVLYDPTCDHCHEIIEQLGRNAEINGCIAEGTLTVLAINLVAKHPPGDLPSNWHSGTDLSNIDDRDLYIIRATPSLYILDTTHTILAKDIPPENLLK